MKKLRTPALLLIIAVMFAFAACKKDASTATLQLSAVDSGRTVSVVNGQKILVILNNPGDGGYDFDNWQYNSSVLQLVSHDHNAPANPNITGDFGSDTWQFKAMASGTSTLKITASRNGTQTITMFNGTIQVK